MIRFVLGPDNEVVPDLAEKLPGRGIWVSANRALVDKAIRKNLFAKAAKTKVIVDEKLPERVEELLRKQTLNLLGLAQRAGEVRSGFEKTKAMLLGGDRIVLIAAKDGASDGRVKLRNIFCCD